MGIIVQLQCGAVYMMLNKLSRLVNAARLYIEKIALAEIIVFNDSTPISVHAL
jgi:hypothetical protein